MTKGNPQRWVGLEKREKCRARIAFQRKVYRVTRTILTRRALINCGTRNLTFCLSIASPNRGFVCGANVGQGRKVNTPRLGMFKKRKTRARFAEGSRTSITDDRAAGSKFGQVLLLSSVFSFSFQAIPIVHAIHSLSLLERSKVSF